MEPTTISQGQETEQFILSGTLGTERGSTESPPPSSGTVVKTKTGGSKMYELTDKQKEDIKTAFETLDYDHSGWIQTKDLKIGMRALGFEPRKSDITKIISQVDKKNSGKLNFDEFSTLMASKLAEKDTKAEIMKAFSLFDRDGTGKITFKNLQQIATELGEVLGDEEIMEMISEADQDGDGMVSCDEFYRIMKKTSLY